MHPIIHDNVAKAQIADWHRQAERDRLARAARPARRARDKHFVASHLATVLAHRALAVLNIRGIRPPRPQPEQAPKATS